MVGSITMQFLMLESRNFHFHITKDVGEALVSLNIGSVDGQIFIETATYPFTQFYFYVCSALR